MEKFRLCAIFQHIILLPLYQKKTNTMASNLFKRYIWLADTIHRYGPITLAEIRARWQHSALYDGRPLARRTFHTHRDAVEELFDLSIVCDERTNRYSIANSEDLSSHNITNWLLDSFAVGQSLREARTLHNRVLVEEVPSARGHLPELLDAMRENRQVVVTYQPFTGDEAFDLRLRPLFVKLRNRRWYLYADKPDDEKIKLYALDRVVKICVTEDRFTPPEELDPAGYLAGAFGVAVYDDIRPCTIRVRVVGNGVKYLRTLPLHSSQQEVEAHDDYAIFEFHVAPTPEFYQAMLNCHCNFEVLSPGNVREEMRRIIGDLEALYDHTIQKVIFLDFDGVMNTERYIAERRRNGLPVSDRYGYLFDPEAVDNLRRIINATGAAVIISSSWRLEGEERMEAMWHERTLPGQLIGVTGQSPHTNFPVAVGRKAGVAKGEEIRSWLKEHAPQPCCYVIFDDEADIRSEQLPHFIHTDPRIGITRADAERAIRILNGEDHD